MKIKQYIYLICALLATCSPLGSVSDALAKSSTEKSAKKTPVKTTTIAKKSSASKVASRKIIPIKRYVPEPEKFSALVVDADTGKVLYEKNAGNLRYPASLTKMMTLYLTFEALKKGQLKMDQTLVVSAKAASQPQTNLSLEPGDRVPVRTIIESLVVRSANDSAMTVAEALGGTQWNFALMMTKKARQLGMKNTVFKNPNGLPDNGQHTTAFDMARLGIALRRDFPEYYHYFSLPEFSYNGITYPTHNRVIGRYPGADGVKTGYIRASGFNVVTSVKRNGYNIVAVVMGGNTANSRDDQMIAMLDRTFAQLPGRNKGVAKSEEEKKSETGQADAGETQSLALVQAP